MEEKNVALYCLICFVQQLENNIERRIVQLLTMKNCIISGRRKKSAISLISFMDFSCF